VQAEPLSSCIGLNRRHAMLRWAVSSRR
jgi:hypothetical protein